MNKTIKNKQVCKKTRILTQLCIQTRVPASFCCNTAATSCYEIEAMVNPAKPNFSQHKQLSLGVSTQTKVKLLPPESSPNCHS